MTTETINTIIKDFIIAEQEFNMPIIDIATNQLYNCEPSCFHNYKGNRDKCLNEKYQKIHYKLFNEWIPETLKYNQIEFNK